MSPSQTSVIDAPVLASARQNLAQSLGPALEHSLELTPALDLQALQAENVKLQRFLAAQRTVVNALETRAGRSLGALEQQVQQLQVTSPESTAWQTGLDAMQHEINRLCDLLADTMLLQKLEAGKVEIRQQVLDLRMLVLAMTRHWLDSASETVDVDAAAVAGWPAADPSPARLACEIPPALPDVLADPDLTEAALMDLVARGLRYSDGPVALKVEPLQATRDRISIQITAQRFAPAGDRTFATELVLCCRRIEVQGGAIACEPHPDGLQTVVIELPVAS